MWGEVDLLGPIERVALQRQLEAASQALGNPVIVLLVDRLSQAGTAAVVAAETFEGRQMADLSRDPVLLVVALHDRQAAIETGKGPFGIVPELDARGIVARLTRHLSRANLADRLSLAGRDIVASATATQLRRRPLPPDEPSGAPTAADVAASSAADSAARAIAEAEPELAPPAEAVPPAKPRSRKPFAIAAGVLFLLSLALYKRHQMSVTRQARAAAAPPPPRIGPGDRRPPA